MNLGVNNARKQKKFQNIGCFESLRHLAVLRFLQMQKDNSKARIAASEAVAGIVFGKSEAGSYRSRIIRDWADHYMKFFELPFCGKENFRKPNP